MQEYRAHLTMLNDKIRKRILDFYYEQWHKSTGLWISCEHLIGECDIKPELLAANIVFLIEEGLLRNVVPLSGTHHIPDQ